MYMSANQAAVQLSISALAKLLNLARDAAGNGVCSAAGNISSSARILESCQQIVPVLAQTVHTAAEYDFWDRGDSALEAVDAEHSSAGATSNQHGQGAVLQLAGQHSQCCKVLQDGVRLMVARAAGALSIGMKGLSGVFRNVATLLDRVHYQADTSRPAISGPLIAAVAAGDASGHDALQLFGLLCSLLKAYSSGSNNMAEAVLLSAVHSSSSAADSQIQSDITTAVLAAVSDMLKGSWYSGSSGSHVHNSTNGVSSSSSSSDGTYTCTAALPWLVLLGRCCCGCAALMHHCQCTLQSDGLPERPRQWTLHKQTLDNNLQELQTSLADVVQWLAADSALQKLTALGYQPQDLQQQLAMAAQALTFLRSDLQAADPFSATGHGAAVAVLQAAQEQLLAASRVLACFAIPHACNNPACGNLSGPSEAQLVGGRSCICAGCRIARYCGKACQRAVWRQHKPVCKALAAEAAAAAGT